MYNPTAVVASTQVKFADLISDCVTIIGESETGSVSELSIDAKYQVIQAWPGPQPPTIAGVDCHADMVIKSSGRSQVAEGLDIAAIFAEHGIVVEFTVNTGSRSEVPSLNLCLRKSYYLTNGEITPLPTP